MGHGGSGGSYIGRSVRRKEDPRFLTGEGLFVAGVHQNKVLVVGRSYVQALKIEDGEPAWLEPALAV